MRLFVYTVYDSCAGRYDRPFCAMSDGEAMRSFGDIACAADHPLGQHPEHYSIFRLGEYDDNSAVIKLEENGKVFLSSAVDLIALNRKIARGNLDLFEDDVNASLKEEAQLQNVSSGS